MGQFGIGQSVTRIEDLRLLTGGGKYTDDVQLAGESHGFILRSPHASAAIKGIDTAAAKAAPGVLAVLTGEDIAADDVKPLPNMFPVASLDGTERPETYRPLLAQERVRYVGDPIALVVADTLAEARDAAELIEVDYDVLPSVTDTFKAAQPGAPLVHDHMEGNLSFDWGKGDKEATDAAFAKADHVTVL